MNLLAIIINLRFQDVLDIVFLTVVAYYLYLWFKGTKAFKALVGLLVLGIVFTAARTWGLFLTTWVFQILWQVLVILLIILFQSEIRQVLEKVNPLKSLGFHKLPEPGEWGASFSEGIFYLAGRMIGALVIIERLDTVDEWIIGGKKIAGEPDQDMLLTVFQKESPWHDGAMIIRNGQVSSVANYLPISQADGLPPEWGTRHRAAIGITEKCDACTVVVSEEKGDVTFAMGGQMNKVESKEKLSRLIYEAVAPLRPPGVKMAKRVQSIITNRWAVKLGSLALVSLVWLMLAGQQDFQVTFSVPLELKNIPSGIEIMAPMEPEARITVRGLRKDASTLNERNVHAELDLSLAGAGKKIFPLTRVQVSLPNDRVQVVGIEPAQLEFKFRQNP